MKYETIVCPFCGNGSAHITYEENRVYQMNCTDCHNAIFHQDTSWDAAVKFFKRMEITDGTRLRELAEADKDGRCSAGCIYCRERKPILDDIGQLQIDDSDSTLWYIAQVAADDIYEDHTEIRYCPMCGRKLTREAAEAALEAQK